MRSNRDIKEDEFIKKIINEFEVNPKPWYSIINEVLKFQDRLCVPNIHELKRRILDEARKSMFTIHLGSNKMYQDLK